MIRKEFRVWMAWDYELEEMWINKMAEQGWHLKNVSMGTIFTFEKGEPGAYQYRLEMLDDAQRDSYLAFMEEAGIEKIGGYLKWVYFRKKNDGTPFELFSDVKSRINHLQRIKKLMDTMKILLTVVIALDYTFYVIDILTGRFSGAISMIMMLPCVFICLCIWNGSKQLQYQISDLQQEQMIHE